MKEVICIGSKHNGYTIDLKNKKMIIHFFNSFYENVFHKKEKHKEINFNDIDFINVTYSAHDRTIWGIDCMLLLEVVLKNGAKYNCHGNIEATKKEFLGAYKSLKNNNIKFIDKFNIIDALVESNLERIDLILVDLIKNSKLNMY